MCRWIFREFLHIGYMKQQKNDVHVVTAFEDIYLASALVCNRHELLGVQENAPGRFAFEFEDSPDLKKHVSDYWNGAMRLEPREFANAIRDLKARTKMRAAFF